MALLLGKDGLVNLNPDRLSLMLAGQSQQNNRNEIIPGILFHGYSSEKKRETVAFLEDITLVLQISGYFSLETAQESVSIKKGMILLIGRNQLGQITKSPCDGERFQTIIISLKEDLLRQIAIGEGIEIARKFVGPTNIIIPDSDFFRAYFQSVLPYINHSGEPITRAVGLLKVKEVVLLLLDAFQELKDFLFDFSAPHKMDLEKFMMNNFHYNLPIEKFAQLTGRSLTAFKRDFQKKFEMSPRQWLQEQRLIEARRLIEKMNKKPSIFYLDLGFESLAHFSRSFKKRFGKAPSEFLPTSIK
jgi:AraC-like DNA-binding protein